MSARDYFSDGYPRQRTNADPEGPSQYYGSQFDPSPQPTPAPSYHSNLPAASLSRPHSRPTPNQLPPQGPSPFDSVFDDNMYPAASRLYDGDGSKNISQQSLCPDSAYDGQGGGSPGTRSIVAEDIPLQERPVNDMEMVDHIYDDPSGGKKDGRRRQKVRMGELGMYGTDKKRVPWLVYSFSLIQIVVLIAMMVRNALLTGSPIEIHPQFNPMIGPSTQIMINMGGCFDPCMHFVKSVQGAEPPGIEFLCPNATTDTETCPLKELCGFGGTVPNPIFDGKFTQAEKPNQWWRFILAIFIHAGIIHIGFNLLVQLTIGKQMEIGIGHVRFFLIYMSSGIFGFVMGGNFAAPAMTSVGASGALFGIIALTLLDLLYSWRERKNPVKELMFILLDMVISFVLGLLPGLDNFAHIGGFLMGICLGICLLHSPNALRRKLGEDPYYSSVRPARSWSKSSILHDPVGFFKGRKPLWWLWWAVRTASLVTIIVVFVLLLNNFYSDNPETCHWCKYLSCLPVNGWCELGTIPQTNSSSSSR